MKLVYLDHNLFGDFISDNVPKILQTLRNRLQLLRDRNEILIVYSPTHIQESAQRKVKSNIIKELKCIADVTNNHVISFQGGSIALTIKSPFAIYEILGNHNQNKVPEIEQLLKATHEPIFDNWMEKSGFSAKQLNDLSAEELIKRINYIIQNPSIVYQGFTDAEKFQAERIINEKIVIFYSVTSRLY